MAIRPGTHKPNSHIAKTDKHLSASEVRLNFRERGYTTQWDKMRLHYLRKHPLCVHCQAKGRVTVATDLDHIVPHKGDMIKFWNKDNLQGLCHSCHSIKTASEDGGFGHKYKNIL
jgi:5-methylcytosine-specific restriction protein A